MKNWLLFILLSLSIMACQNQSTEQETIVEPSTSTSTNDNEQKVTATTTGVQYLETSIGKIPIYETFGEVAHLFEKQNDTTYVVNFWATWCKPCVKELPFFERMQSERQEDKVQVVLVSLDFKRQLESKLKPFLEEHKLQSEVVAFVDGKYNNWIDKVSQDWSGAIPATVVYNKSKKIFHASSFPTYQELAEKVDAVAGS